MLLISDSDYESNQSETEENHQYSIVPKETFIELQRFSGEWKYTDNSYYMGMTIMNRIQRQRRFPVAFSNT